MSALITLADLNTTINHEPRVLDTLIAERLGFSRFYKIRELIDRNKEELETYGTLATRQTESRGQSYNEYWLNEAQALLICTFARTAKAALVRKALIDAYQAYRRDPNAQAAKPAPQVEAKPAALPAAPRRRSPALSLGARQDRAIALDLIEVFSDYMGLYGKSEKSRHRPQSFAKLPDAFLVATDAIWKMLRDGAALSAITDELRTLGQLMAFEVYHHDNDGTPYSRLRHHASFTSKKGGAE